MADVLAEQGHDITVLPPSDAYEVPVQAHIQLYNFGDAERLWAVALDHTQIPISGYSWRVYAPRTAGLWRCRSSLRHSGKPGNVEVQQLDAAPLR